MSLVLVVEDDDVIRETIATLIEMEGHEVQEARNGQEALDLLSQGSELPCLILLDLMMPVMDGIEFRQRQLQTPGFAPVPVIVITGSSDLTDIRKLRPQKIIAKPFTADAILRAVDDHCTVL
jgi:CheY-like chemotaxis protein